MNHFPRAALLVIDMQNGFLNPDSAQCIRMAAATVPACAAAIQKARALKIPVFYIKRQYRMDGTDVELCRYTSWKAGGCAMAPGSHGPISEEFPPELQPRMPLCGGKTAVLGLLCYPAGHDVAADGR